MLFKPKPLSQSSGSGDWLNKLSRYSNQHRPQFCQSQQSVHSSKGFLPGPFAAAGAGGGGADVLRMRFKSLDGEHNKIVCRTWDGAVEGEEDYEVALPYKLRAQTWDGLSVTIPALVNASAITVRYYKIGPQERRANNAESAFDEYQSIVPRYLVDDELMAIEASIVIYSGVEIVESLSWLDMNIDARAWARL